MGHGAGGWVIGALVALCACEGEHDELQDSQDDVVSQGPVVPEDFERVDTGCNFQFYAPPGIESIPTAGIDSCIARFKLDDCELVAASGAYSGKLAETVGQPEYEREKVTVDGRAATLVRYRQEQGDQLYSTALHVPISDEDGWYISIDLYASCVTPQSRDRLRDALLSLDPSEKW